jgi:hypothetical protein
MSAYIDWSAVLRCCTCDPDLCESDDTGEHCEIRSCGACLHGCPAAAGQPCCLDTTGGAR